MEADIPDLHHKMSKKIAQLTKVIYHLNSRNDDYESEIKSMGSHHENEIEYILKDACRRLGEFQEDINLKNEQIRQTKTVEALQLFHEAEKKDFLENFETFKENSRTIQKDLETKYETQIMFITRDLEGIQQQFLSKVKEFSDITQQTQETHDSALKALQTDFDGKVLEITRSKDELQNILNSERSKIKGLLEQQLADKAHFERALSEQEQQFMSVKQLLELEHSQQTSKLQSDFNSNNQVAGLEYSKLQKLNEEQNTQIQNLRLTIQTNLDAKQSLEQQIAKEKHHHSEEILNLTKSIEKCQAKLNEVTEQLQNANARYLNIEQQSTLSSTELKQQYASLMAQLKLENTNMLEKEQAHGTMVTQLKGNISKLGDDLHSAQSKIQLMQNEKLDLHKQIQLLTNHLPRSISEILNTQQNNIEQWQSKLAQLNTKITHQTQQMTSFSGKIQQLRENISELQQSKLTLNSHLEEKEKLLGSTNTQIQDLQSQLQGVIQENEALKASMQQESTHTSAEFEHLQQKFNQQISVLQTSLKEKDTEIERLQGEIFHHSSMIQSLHDSMSQLKEESQSTLISALSAQEVEWKEKLKLAEGVLANKLERQHKLEFLNMQKESKSSSDILTEVIAQHQQKINECNSIISSQQQQTDQLNASIQELHQAHLNNVQGSNQNWADRVEQIKNDFQEKQQELLKQHETALLEKQKNHDRLLSENNQSLALYPSCTQLWKTILELNEAHNQNIAKLTEELETKWASFNEKDKQKKAEEVMKLLKAEKDMALANLKENSKQEQRSLQLTLDSKNDKIRELETHLKELQAQIIANNTEINQLNQELNYKDNNFILMRNELLAELKDSQEKASHKYDSLVATLEKKHRDNTQQITNEFSNSQTLLEGKCADLQQRLVEADYHYKNRSPREQDVELIQSLRNEISDSMQSIARLKNDQKQMRLELQNREENLNKIFNKSPQIGITMPKQPDLHKSPSTPPKLPPLSARGEKSTTKSGSKKNVI